MILNCPVSVNWFTKSILVKVGDNNENNSFFSFSPGLQEKISKSIIKKKADRFILGALLAL
jgi:hypothetical protein